MNVRIQALGDLIKRYSAAFNHAWQHRAEMETVQRLSYEAQFLPAALSLQDTPVSPAPRFAMWLLIGFAALTLIWSIFGHIDVVATAQGKIVPNGRTKTIQPFETATVKAIHVADGQTVKAGDVLIELDATSVQADKDRIISDLAMARLQEQRGKALLEALEIGKTPVLQRPQDIDNTQFEEAQTAYADDLLSIYQQALEADPELKSSETKIKIGTAQKGQALGEMLPQVTGSANWSTNSQNQFNPIKKRDQTSDYNGTRYVVSLNQTLIDFPKFWTWKKAQATESQYTLENVQAQQTLLLKVADSYFTVLEAEDELSFFKSEEETP